jgi:hypothetical protein
MQVVEGLSERLRNFEASEVTPPLEQAPDALKVRCSAAACIATFCTALALRCSRNIRLLAATCPLQSWPGAIQNAIDRTSASGQVSADDLNANLASAWEDLKRGARAWDARLAANAVPPPAAAAAPIKAPEPEPAASRAPVPASEPAAPAAVAVAPAAVEASAVAEIASTAAPSQPVAARKPTQRASMSSILKDVTRGGRHISQLSMPFTAPSSSSSGGGGGGGRSGGGATTADPATTKPPNKSGSNRSKNGTSAVPSSVMAAAAGGGSAIATLDGSGSNGGAKGGNSGGGGGGGGQPSGDDSPWPWFMQPWFFIAVLLMAALAVYATKRAQHVQQ